MAKEFTPKEFTPRVIEDLGMRFQSNMPKMTGSTSGAMALDEFFESELDVLFLSIGKTASLSTASPLAVHAINGTDAHNASARPFNR
jgi:hypothetical protein